jgi:hypothetical protein
MKYDLPPFNEKEKHGFIEQNLLDISSGLFKNQTLGFTLAILTNFLFIYLYFKSKSCISLLIYLFLVYIIISIIISQLANISKNK